MMESIKSSLSLASSFIKSDNKQDSTQDNKQDNKQDYFPLVQMFCVGNYGDKKIDGKKLMGEDEAKNIISNLFNNELGNSLQKIKFIGENFCSRHRTMTS